MRGGGVLNFGRLTIRPRSRSKTRRTHQSREINLVDCPFGARRVNKQDKIVTFKRHRSKRCLLQIFGRSGTSRSGDLLASGGATETSAPSVDPRPGSWEGW